MKRILTTLLLALPLIAAAQSPIPTDPTSPPWAQRKSGPPLAIHQGTGTPTTPTPAGLYVAMGDSITFGYGANPNCQAFPTHPVDPAQFCPEGRSYATLVALALRNKGIAGQFMNLGISGAHVERILSDELPYLPAEATLITLYIGTNDSRAVRNTKTTIKETVAQFEKNYDVLLASIHKQAPHAKIVLINFPNEQYLAESYHFAPEALPRFNATSQILDKFIDDHYPTYPVVDTICNPSSYDKALLYNETVHPNEEGSAILAKAVLDIILAANPAAPPTTCKWFNANSLPSQN